MITLVTPVGTSLFTNYLDNNSSNGNFRRWYDAVKKRPASEWNNYDSEIEALRISSCDFIATSKVKTSAELQSIANIQKRLDVGIKAHLIASDTIASRLAAEILKEQSGVLVNNITVEFNDVNDVIKGLQIENRKVFSQEGMTNLVRKIDSISGGILGTQTPNFTRSLAINITGGYKATLPYLTILAQLERIPLYYNFEDTDELIKIPQAPLVIDWASIDRHSDVLRQIDDEGIDNWQAFQQQHFQAIQDLEAFFEVDGEVALLSPIGEIFWNHYQKYYLVKLPIGNYHRYNSSNRRLIDKAIEELYRKLDTALRPDYLAPETCYEHIRSLGHNSDLNHSGQIPGQDIFIFKSTDNDQIRLLYTFQVKAYRIEVNGQEANAGEIIGLTIFDLHCGDFNHDTYFRDWKNRFGGQNKPEIEFVTRTLKIPQVALADISKTRDLRIRTV